MRVPSLESCPLRIGKAVEPRLGGGRFWMPHKSIGVPSGRLGPEVAEGALAHWHYKLVPKVVSAMVNSITLRLALTHRYQSVSYDSSNSGLCYSIVEAGSGVISKGGWDTCVDADTYWFVLLSAYHLVGAGKMAVSIFRHTHAVGIWSIRKEAYLFGL